MSALLEAMLARLRRLQAEHGRFIHTFPVTSDEFAALKAAFPPPPDNGMPARRTIHNTMFGIAVVVVEDPDNYDPASSVHAVSDTEHPTPGDPNGN